MEDGSLVVALLSAEAEAGLAGAQRAEVIGGEGAGVAVELKRHAPGRLVTDGDVEVDDGVGRVGHGHVGCRGMCGKEKIKM